MALVIIPEDYEELPKGLAPICIEDRDRSGNPINPELINDGVRPIHKPLCRVTTTILRDVRLVSEVVDNAVQSVWRRHGSLFGDEARQRVYARSIWEAKRMRADWRKQKGREGSLDDRKYLDTVDSAVRMLLFDAEGALRDPRDYAAAYNARIDSSIFARSIGNEEFRKIIDFYTYGWTWPEIAVHLGRKPATVRRRFFRWTGRFRGE